MKRTYARRPVTERTMPATMQATSQTIAMWVSVTMAVVAVGGLIVSAMQLRHQMRYYRRMLDARTET